MGPRRRSLGLLRLALAGALAAAGASTATGDAEIPVGRVVDRIVTAHDAEQAYALYLPTGYGEQDRLWPVLFVLDPRGRAVPGVERFLPAAERLGYVVLSSYESRSDVPGDVNIRALDALLKETEARFRFHPRRLYLAGFSGTAHASWRFGQILEEHVAGVIAIGGGVQTKTQGPPGDARFAYYGIAGTADFNYRELLRLEEHLLASGVAHRVVIFEGRHSWPPFEYTNRALDWMELQAVRRGLAETNPELVAAELEQARATAAAARDPLDLLRRHRDIVRDFPDAPGIEVHVEAVRRLEADPKLRARRTEEQRLAKEELAHIDRWYRPWIAKLESDRQRLPTVAESMIDLRVGVFQERAADREEPAKASSAERILERLYTGVAFYHPRDYEEAGDFERAILSLQVAVAIFPERAGAHWRLASTLVTAGRKNDGIEALRRAISFGRVDVERLKTDPAWKPLHDRPDWPELVAAAEAGTR